MKTNDGKQQRSASKGRRVTVDLTPAAAAEVDRLKAATGLTTAALFRHSLTLLRVYAEAERDGKQIKIVNGGESDRLVLPFVVGS